MADWFGTFFLAFIPLFVAIDPLGMAGLFLSLTQDMERHRQRRIARQAIITALAAGLAFMLGGTALLSALGLGLPDFLVAGGIILLVIGVRSLLENEREALFSDDDFGVVPLGLPLIAGPAMLTALLALMDTQGISATLAALAANLLLTYLSMVHVRRIVGWMGVNGIRAVSKIVALLLVAIAVNMIRRGVQAMLESM